MSSIARWVTEHQAAQIVERSPKTVQAWRLAGEVIAHKQGQRRTMYLVESLEECQRRMDERYRNRPNPGRPPKD